MEDYVTTVDTSAPAYSVAVVDDDPKLRTILAMHLGDMARAASFPNLAVLDGKTAPGVPMVVVLGPSFATPETLTAAVNIVRARPEFVTVLVADELSTAILQQAMRSGVSDVITLSAAQDQLSEAVLRAGDGLAAFASKPPAPAPVEEAAGDRGRVISVFSAKGGAGKSVVAANLAILLARRSDKPVALLDADLQFGDTAVMMKLSPQHTVVDAVNSISRLDVPLLKSLLVRHELSGVHVLPAPTEPAFADQVGAQDMLKIIDLLREFCGYVVVDTPAHFNEVVLSVLEGSDDIVLVAGMDIPNIKNVKIGLQTLRLLGIPMTKLKLVLNRANSKVKLDIGEVERTLQMKADALIPSDIVVPRSVNKGVPVVLDEPKSPVAKSLEQLATLFAPATAGLRRR
jgi:pilus assembly protein CpaE